MKKLVIGLLVFMYVGLASAQHIEYGVSVGRFSWKSDVYTNNIRMQVYMVCDMYDNDGIAKMLTEEYIYNAQSLDAVWDEYYSKDWASEVDGMPALERRRHKGFGLWCAALDAARYAERKKLREQRELILSKLMNTPEAQLDEWREYPIGLFAKYVLPDLMEV